MNTDTMVGYHIILFKQLAHWGSLYQSTDPATRREAFKGWVFANTIHLQRLHIPARDVKPAYGLVRALCDVDRGITPPEFKAKGGGTSTPFALLDAKATVAACAELRESLRQKEGAPGRALLLSVRDVIAAVNKRLLRRAPSGVCSLHLGLIFPTHSDSVGGVDTAVYKHCSKLANSKKSDEDDGLGTYRAWLNGSVPMQGLSDLRRWYAIAVQQCVETCITALSIPQQPTENYEDETTRRPEISEPDQ